MSDYEVRDVVCDYGVYCDDELVLICNSRSNAELICEIMSLDHSHKKFQLYEDIDGASANVDLVVRDGKIIKAKFSGDINDVAATSIAVTLQLIKEHGNDVDKTHLALIHAITSQHYERKSK